MHWVNPLPSLLQPMAAMAGSQVTELQPLRKAKIRQTDGLDPRQRSRFVERNTWVTTSTGELD